MSSRLASRTLAMLGIALFGCANPVTEDADVEAAVVAQPLLEGECDQAETESLLETFSWTTGAIDQAAATTPVSDPVRWYTWFSSASRTTRSITSNLPWPRSRPGSSKTSFVARSTTVVAVGQVSRLATT